MLMRMGLTCFVVGALAVVVQRPPRRARANRCGHARWRRSGLRQVTGPQVGPGKNCFNQLFRSNDSNEQLPRGANAPPHPVGIVRDDLDRTRFHGTQFSLDRHVQKLLVPWVVSHQVRHQSVRGDRIFAGHDELVPDRLIPPIDVVDQCLQAAATVHNSVIGRDETSPDRRCSRRCDLLPGADAAEADSRNPRRSRQHSR